MEDNDSACLAGRPDEDLVERDPVRLADSKGDRRCDVLCLQRTDGIVEILCTLANVIVTDVVGQLGRQTLDAPGAARQQRHRRALGCECPRRCLADATGGAGDDRRTSCKVLAHVVLHVWFRGCLRPARSRPPTKRGGCPDRGYFSPSTLTAASSLLLAMTASTVRAMRCASSKVANEGQ